MSKDKFSNKKIIVVAIIGLIITCLCLSCVVTVVYTVSRRGESLLVTPVPTIPDDGEIVPSPSTSPEDDMTVKISPTSTPIPTTKKPTPTPTKTKAPTPTPSRPPIIYN